MTEWSGGGWGSNPSNDPAERESGSVPAGVNKEGFDPKYTGDGASAWDAPKSVGNLKRDSFPQSDAKREPGKSKGYAPGLG